MAGDATASLTEPASVGAVRVALVLLSDLFSAARGIEEPHDHAAAATFRARVRQARDWLELSAAALPPTARKTLTAELRPLQRDAEEIGAAHLELAWLKSQRAELELPHLPGAYWLLRRWQWRCDEAPGERAAERARSVARHAALLDDAASESVGLAEAPTFGTLVADALAAQSLLLHRHLARLRSPDAEGACRRAERACERLRCLLDMLPDDLEGRGAMVQRLASLHAPLSLLNDRRATLAGLRRALRDAGRDLKRHAELLVNAPDPLAPRVRLQVEEIPVAAIYRLATLADEARQGAFAALELARAPTLRAETAALAGQLRAARPRVRITAH